jgi:hypothetical protein
VAFDEDDQTDADEDDRQEKVTPARQALGNKGSEQ